MPRALFWLTLIMAVVLAVLGGRAITAQDTADDKYAVQVPGGLAFAEFRGYERWDDDQPDHRRHSRVLARYQVDHHRDHGAARSQRGDHRSRAGG
jgi:hypothetical protein